MVLECVVVVLSDGCCTIMVFGGMFGTDVHVYVTLMLMLNSWFAAVISTCVHTGRVGSGRFRKFFKYLTREV